MAIAFLDGTDSGNFPSYLHLGLDTSLRVPALSMLTVIVIPTVGAWQTCMTRELAGLRK